MHKNGKEAEARILDIDPWLAPYKHDIDLRMQRYRSVRKVLLGKKAGFRDFANGHKHFGFHRTDDGWFYREWAPSADSLALTGDFNGWNRDSHRLEKKQGGVWEIFLEGRDTLEHGSLVKVHVVHGCTGRDRIPLYIRRVVQNKETHDFCGQIWEPDEKFKWSDEGFTVSAESPVIYETHIGMAQEKEAVGTYREFEENILPRIKEAGYNTVQIMALMEHPYYASFGYHVSNYFAASSWFGTPDELKSLVDKAHSMGITVLMDLVQSHAVKNIAEGISEFDGTDYQFFHTGSRGYHKAWDSKLFNYGRHEVIHFLLSSIKFWMEEYHFDGFRFDGVTSMIYKDHGLGTSFDDYRKYFSMNTDTDAVTYLQFATELIKELRPDSVCIAEDMSGMPGMCLPVEDGGIGFDYRLAMGVPDFWISTLKLDDCDWDMHRMWHELTTSRPGEKRVAYVESHDQALVGDKTLIFRMADKEMYWHMDKDSKSMAVDRAIALHKMARLITISLGCDGYLNFMGNEFGHPDWIDFPREGNGWSFKHCQRLWSLSDSPLLRYGDLKRFDGSMVELMLSGRLLGGGTPKQLWLDQEKKLIAYSKGDYVFLFNFHPTDSYPELEIPVHEDCSLQVVLDTDEEIFGGFSRISRAVNYDTHMLRMNPEYTGITIYSPSRTALVLKKIRI